MPDDSNQTPPPLAPDDPLAPGGRLDVNRLIAEHGDAKAAAAVLARKVNEVERDNAEYRARERAYKAAAPEGSEILQPADVALWNAYRALGTPDDLTAKLSQGEAAATKVAENDRKAALSAVSERVDTALWDTLRDSDKVALSIEGEGDEARVMATPEGGQAVPFEDYAREHYPAAADGLLKQAASPEPVAPAVRSFPAQVAGGRPAAARTDAGSVADRKRAEGPYQRF